MRAQLGRRGVRGHALTQQCPDHVGEAGIRDQLERLGPRCLVLCVGLGGLGVVTVPTPAAGQLAVDRHRVPVKASSCLLDADALRVHRLDPSALVETEPACHTENLHLVVVASAPAIMAD